MHELAHKHHELVQPQSVDSKPFSPHCVQKHREIEESCLQCSNQQLSMKERALGHARAPRLTAGGSIGRISASRCANSACKLRKLSLNQLVKYLTA